jgi:hypothetical protein
MRTILKRKDFNFMTSYYLPSGNSLPGRILDRINALLQRKNIPPLTLEQVFFIHGTKLVSYGKLICLVSRRDLIEVDQFENEFSPFLNEGPIMIQAHLIPMEHKHYLIELMFGPSTGNGSPEIIGKPDLRRIVKII